MKKTTVYLVASICAGGLASAVPYFHTEFDETYRLADLPAELDEAVVRPRNRRDRLPKLRWQDANPRIRDRAPPRKKGPRGLTRPYAQLWLAAP